MGDLQSDRTKQNPLITITGTGFAELFLVSRKEEDPKHLNAVF